MKKLSKVILVGATLFTLTGIVSPVSASTINVNVDGGGLTMDQPPVNVNGRVLVPLRAIFEKLGATVSWDQSTRTITAVENQTKIVLKLDSNVAQVNGQNVTLDVPAKAIGGRTMVPIRFVSEAMGTFVTWDQNTSTVQVSSTGHVVFNVGMDNAMYDRKVNQVHAHYSGFVKDANNKLLAGDMDVVGTISDGKVTANYTLKTSSDTFMSVKHGTFTADITTQGINYTEQQAYDQSQN